MNEEEIKNLKIGKATDIVIETNSGAPLEAGEYPELVSKDQSARENSSSPGENPDIPLQFDKADSEYPGINEHPGYWGIFVRKGS